MNITHMAQVSDSADSQQQWHLCPSTDDLPKPDCFMFADTGWEREGTYENLERLKPIAEAAGIPFHVIFSRNIRQAQFNLAAKGTELPYWVDPSRFLTVEGKRQRLISDIKKAYRKQEKKAKAQGSLFDISLEAMLENTLTDFDRKVEDGLITAGWKQMDIAQMGRQCTYNYKIFPIQKFCRKHYGAHFKTPMGSWIGISTDEWTRMSVSETKAFVNLFPLVEYGMSADDCIQYLEDHDYPVPVRSSCVGCPFTSDPVWRDKTDAEIADSSAFEEQVNIAIQENPILKDRPYYANGVRLHRSMKPISERPFEKGSDEETERDAVCGTAGCFL